MLQRMKFPFCPHRSINFIEKKGICDSTKFIEHGNDLSDTKTYKVASISDKQKASPREKWYVVSEMFLVNNGIA